MKNDNENNEKSPENYRAARIRARREATRAVRRTLLAVAVVAAIYYCVLLATSKNDAPPKNAVPEPPSAVETNATPEPKNEN